MFDLDKILDNVLPILGAAGKAWDWAMTKKKEEAPAPWQLSPTPVAAPSVSTLPFDSRDVVICFLCIAVLFTALAALVLATRVK